MLNLNIAVILKGLIATFTIEILQKVMTFHTLNTDLRSISNPLRESLEGFYAGIPPEKRSGETERGQAKEMTDH